MHFTALLLAQFGALVLGSPIEDTAHTSLLTNRDPTGTDSDANIPFPFEDTEDNINTLAAAFDFLASIPFDDSTVVTQEDVHAWALAHQGEYFTYNTSLDDGTFAPKKQYTGEHDHAGGHSSRDDRHLQEGLEARGLWQIAQCAAEIALFLAENVIPLWKLRKMKTLIAAMGGAWKVAKLLLKARSLADLYKIGKDMKELVQMLVGVAGIASACNLHF